MIDAVFQEYGILIGSLFTRTGVQYISKYAEESELCMVDEFTSLLLLGGFLATQECQCALGVDIVI